MLLKPSPPILLPLTTDSPKPPAMGDLSKQAQKQGKPHRLKPPIIKMGPQRMDRPTVGTTIPLQQQCLVKPNQKTGPHNHDPIALGFCTEDTTEDEATGTSLSSAPKA
jgi:hypothetical protein